MNSTPPVSILLVDNNPLNILALEAVLDGPEYTLVKAHSGYEAIARVEREVFATILLDLQMPGIDGYETAKRIKALPNGKDVPIILVTAVYKEDEDVARGYEAGALDYFAKPFKPGVIKSKVRIYADLYCKTQQLRHQERILAEVGDRMAAEGKLKKVLESVSEAVMVADASGNVTEANDEARRIWGANGFLPIDRYGEHSGWWAESGSQVKPEEWPLARALKKGESATDDRIRLLGLDGAERTLLMSSRPLKDAGGKVTGAVCVMREISSIAPGRREIGAKI